MIRFTVPGDPHGKGRPRVSLRGGRARMYTDSKTVAYEDRVGACAAAAMGLREPIEGPVGVDVVARRRRPQKPGPRHECRSGVTMDGALACTTKPDADNVAKSILDGCTLAGVWRDDTQVVDLRVRTVWAAEGELPSTEVSVWRIQSENADETNSMEGWR